MRKFSAFVVKNRKWITIIFAVLLAGAVVGAFFVDVNYSDVAYLPDDSEVSRGLDKMYGEFGPGGNASAMLSNATYDEALDFKHRMESIRGVKSIIWLDDLFFGIELGDTAIIRAGVESYNSNSQTVANNLQITDGEAIEYLVYVLNRVPENEIQNFINGELTEAINGIISGGGSLQDILALVPLLTGDDGLTYLLTVNMQDATDKAKAKGFLDATIDAAIIPLSGMLGDLIPGDGSASAADIDLNEIVTGINDQLGMFYTSKTGQYAGYIDALFQISFTGSDYDESTVDAIGAIRALEVAEGRSSIYMIGNASTTYNSIQAVNSETMIAMLVAGVIVIIILLLTTTAYWEPVLLLLTIGTAIVLNMGTDMVVGLVTGVGAISYMTKGISSVLILALTMDYSIFLLHRFKQERKNGLGSEEAMITALSSSFSAISSSSLTTIASFVALMFMSYTLGLDMGLVLAKGVVFSLACVFLLMPGLILYSEKLIEKTEHKTFNMTFKKFSKFLVKTRFYLPFIIIALIIPCMIFQSQNDFVYGPEASMGGPDSVMTQDLNTIVDSFGKQNQAIVLIPYDWVTDADTSGYADAAGNPCSTEYNLTTELMNTNGIKTVQSYSLIAQQGMIDMMPDKFITQFVANGTDSEYARVVVFLDVPEEGTQTTEVVTAIQNILNERYDGATLLGQSSATLEIKEIVNNDYNIINYVSIGLVALILIVTFKSAIIPVILIVVIQGSVYINMVFPYILNQQMVFIGYMLVSSILLGATIDYAILLTSRYMERRKTMNKYDAIQHALADSARTLITSAGILTAAGAAVMVVSSLPATRVIGAAVFRGGICSFVMVMVPLPQLLVLLDKAIMYATWKGRQNMVDNKAVLTAPEIEEPSIDAGAPLKSKSGRKKYREMTREEREAAIIQNILNAVDDPDFDPDDEDE